MMKSPEDRRDLIRAGLEDLVPVIAEAYAERDWVYFGYETWADYLSGEFGQLRLARPERVEVVGQLRMDGLSQRAIGAALDVSPMTVGRDLAGVTNDTPERVVGTDGKSYPAKTAHVSHNSGENEWYTPLEYIVPAAHVMGAIDLDPASHPEANKLIGASQFYTKEDDGLRQEWKGRVWMNPPYAQPWVERFAEKLVDEYKQDRVSEACVLVNNATETGWFQHLALVASAICFPKGRVRFWHPDRSTSAPLQGQAVVYFGEHRTEFRREFGPLGFVVMR